MTGTIICIYVVFLILITFIFGKLMLGPLAKVGELREKSDSYAVEKHREKSKHVQKKNITIVDDSSGGDGLIHANQFEEKKGFDADTAILDMSLRSDSSRPQTKINRNLQYSMIKEDFSSLDGKPGMLHTFGND